MNVSALLNAFSLTDAPEAAGASMFVVSVSSALNLVLNRFRERQCFVECVCLSNRHGPALATPFHVHRRRADGLR